MQRSIIPAACLIFIVHALSASGKPVAASPVRSKSDSGNVEASVGASNGASPYVKWENGPPHDAAFFPIAVWLQNPGKARRYYQRRRTHDDEKRQRCIRHYGYHRRHADNRRQCPGHRP